MPQSLFLIFFILILSCIPLSAQDGTLDISFDGDGMLTSDINLATDKGRAMAVQADGKVIVAGHTTVNDTNHICLIRYQENGAKDSSFGNLGIVITNLSIHSSAHDIAIQDDGKMIVVAQGTGRFLALRYLSNGSIDSTFGNQGQVNTAIIGNNAFANEVILQADGKIVLGGSVRNSGWDGYAFALTRYTSTGQVDSTFGQFGIVITDIVPGGGLSALDQLKALALQPNGKIIAGGVSGRHFGLSRYLIDGSLDPSFGNGGMLTTSISQTGNEVINSLEVHPDGSIFAGGFSVDTLSNFAIVKYQANGNLDSSFAQHGISITRLSADRDGIEDMIIQPDGKILAGGVIIENNFPAFAIARFDSLGNLDQTFGQGGFVQTKVDGKMSSLASISLQADGKIIAAGTGGEHPNTDFILARYSSSITADDPMISDLHEIKVFPNPFSDELYIHAPIASLLTISIIDMRGIQIKYIPLQSNSYTEKVKISTSDLAQGIYMIQLETARGKVTYKVVKK